MRPVRELRLTSRVRLTYRSRRNKWRSIIKIQKDEIQKSLITRVATQIAVYFHFAYEAELLYFLGRTVYSHTLRLTLVVTFSASLPKLVNDDTFKTFRGSFTNAVSSSK